MDGESEHSLRPSDAMCVGSSDVCVVFNPFAHSAL